MPDILAHVVAALLYGALGLRYWQRHWKTVDDGTEPQPAPAWERYAVAAPLALHFALLYSTAWRPDGLHLGLGVAVSVIVAVTVLIYWAGSWVYRIGGLQSFVLLGAAASVLLPLVLPAPKPLPNTELVAFRLHLLISMLAYSLFTIASLHVALMALMERRLHGGDIPPALAQLPPLLTMETMLFQVIGAGFVLLTLTVASGVLFSEALFGKPLQFNHKTLFGLLSWLIFGLLLGGRIFRGWRGRVAVRWTLAGFLMLVLAYIGSKFVLEVILRR